MDKNQLYQMKKEEKGAMPKVLILDDNEDILEMLSDLLTGEGYNVTGFTTVTDVVQLAEENQPDIIILDYLLSGINGGEYCHQLKKSPQTRHIPVIMLSAHQRVIDSLGNYGWDEFIAKPFEVSVLIGKIKHLLA